MHFRFPKIKSFLLSSSQPHSTTAKLSILFLLFSLSACLNKDFGPGDSVYVPQANFCLDSLPENQLRSLDIPDSIPLLSPCTGLIYSDLSFVDLNLYRYLHQVDKLEELEAYYLDWHWLNSIESTSTILLVFDFGPDNYLLPFLLEDGFFPGAVDGRYGLWEDGQWLCGGEFSHYSTMDVEIPSHWSEEQRLAFLYRDFQSQFWAVLSDSLQQPISPPTPVHHRSR